MKGKGRKGREKEGKAKGQDCAILKNSLKYAPITEDTCNGEDANSTGSPDFVLFEEKGEEDEHSAVMHDPPHVDGSAQATPSIWKVVDTARQQQRQTSAIDRIHSV